MKTLNLRAWLLSVLAVCLVAAWAIVIMVAISVSQIVLASLEMIVELAAITP